METNQHTQALASSIRTFVEVLSNALIFNPQTHPSPYVKAQWFQINPKGKFNAQVTEYERGQRLPGPKYEFNLGIWYALLDSVACLCAEQAFFPDIEVGNITPSIYPLFQGTRRFQDYSGLADKKSLLSPDPPHFSASLRQQLADQQIEIAVKFVSLHEQAHVWAGHLLYINQYGTSELLEIDEDDPLRAGTEQRRAIELQADAIAFQTLFQVCAPRLEELHANEQRFFNIQSPVDWLTACVTATVITACLFEIADIAQTKAAPSRQHPSARCRTLSLFQIFVALLLPLVNTDAELHAALRKVLHNTTSIFQVLGVAPLEKEAITWLWRPSSATPNCDSVLELLKLQTVQHYLEPELQIYQREVQRRLRILG